MTSSASLSVTMMPFRIVRVSRSPLRLTAGPSVVNSAGIRRHPRVRPPRWKVRNAVEPPFGVELIPDFLDDTPTPNLHALFVVNDEAAVEDLRSSIREDVA